MSKMKTVLLAMSFAILHAGYALAEEVAAHGEAGVHKGGGMPQFNFESWAGQIFWMVVFFIILYTIFSKAVLPAISDTLETRKSHIEGHVKAAEILSAEAEQIETALKEALRNAGHKASEEIQLVENEAKARNHDALSSFRSRFESDISSAEGRIAKACQNAMSDMDSIAADIATKMAEKIAGIKADPSQAETVVRSLSDKGRKAA